MEALKVFTLVTDAKGGERGIINAALDMYYSSGQVMIDRSHERKLKNLWLCKNASPDQRIKRTHLQSNYKETPRHCHYRPSAFLVTFELRTSG